MFGWRMGLGPSLGIWWWTRGKEYLFGVPLSLTLVVLCEIVQILDVNVFNAGTYESSGWIFSFPHEIFGCDYFTFALRDLHFNNLSEKISHHQKK